MKLITCSLFLLFVASGCVSIQRNYKLQVQNKSGHPIKNVEILYGDELKGNLTELPAKEERSKIRVIEKMPKTFTVKWQDHEGHPFEKSLSPKFRLETPFRGSLTVVILDAGEADLFADNKFVLKKSDIPDNAPADWEGSPSIPGFDNN